jgi:quercetin dioxygenase-like cupin family protein
MVAKHRRCRMARPCGRRAHRRDRTAPAHVHSGPEAWYTLTGETCLETPDGVQIGRAGGQYVIVPGGPPMHLTATGKEQRQALVLILHDSTKPATTLVSDWTPKGLCKN